MCIGLNVHLLFCIMELWIDRRRGKYVIAGDFWAFGDGEVDEGS